MTIPGRQKPLKGGLNQLNSSQDKTKILPITKKPAPTNFAQAVAAAPSVIKEEHSNLILALGTVESILSDNEAAISIPEYGNFNIHLKQLDLGYKPTFPISKYLTPKHSTLSVTLKGTGKPITAGVKPKHEIVRAHVNADKKVFEDKFDPFLNDFKPRSKVVHPVVAPDSWEDQADGEKSKNGNHENGDDIDLNELDEYYDELDKIINYLEKELPKVIPTVANDKNCIEKLANKVLSNPKNDEAIELQAFLDHQQIPSRIKHIFIAEYLKFRSKDDEENFNLSYSSPRSVDPDVERRLKLFFNWLKNKEKKAESFGIKIDLYSFVIKKFPFVGSEWIKAMNEPKDSHFKSFMKKSNFGEANYSKFNEETSLYLLKHDKNVPDLTTLITWLETDTNSYRSDDTNDASDDGNNENITSGTLGLNLTKFEKEFYEYHLSKSNVKNIVFIIRAVQFLRYSEIKFEGLHKLHLRCHDDQYKPKHRDFIQKIQNLLFKWANQRVLDDVNLFLYRETKGSDKDPNFFTSKRLDKYIPVLSQMLCDFFGDKYQMKRNAKTEEKSIAKKDDDRQDKKDIVETLKRKRTHDGKTVSGNGSYNELDYVGFSHFLELAVASERVTLAPTASVESILWTFQAKNISFSKLEEIYSKSQQMGGCSWQFQISQLKMNPPLGVTIPEIAEYLSAYFASVNNTNTTQAAEAEDNDADNDEAEELEVVSEEDLLTMIQKNLYDQYREPEVTRFVKDLKKSTIKTREAELIENYSELYTNHLLFNKSYWPHNEDQFDFAPQCSLISAGIWHDLNVTSDFLSMCVKNIHDNDLNYQAVLIKWAKMLESSTVFTSSVLDIFTIIKATLLCFDDSVPDEEFMNISTNYCLYNVEGYVTDHMSDSIFCVQTQFSLVLCHLGVTYCQCSHDTTFPLPSDHWKQCCMETCVPVGTKVFLHSTGIKDPKNKIICQIADIVWNQGHGGIKSDPPETGILLPGSVTYKKYVQYFAEKLVSKTTHSLFSDTNYSSNSARYMELDNLYMEQIFLMSDTWSHKSILEMRKEFVFCEMGGMTQPLLRSNWAGALNTSDQEKERLLNETFNFFQNDQETMEMIDFIKPYVERAGLRNAMKIMNQRYPDKDEEPDHLNDTDSEKRKNLSSDSKDDPEAAGTNNIQAKENFSRPGSFPHRNRQLSTDTIKDETLWMAENNLEQLWAEENEQEKSKRMDDLAEVNDDSEEYIEDEENPDKETKQLGAIGSSKPKTGRDSLSPNNEDNDDAARATTPTKTDQNNKSNLEDRLDKMEAAVCNMATWQPVASDIISGNRDLIVQLSNRIEYLENALNQLTLNLATGNVAAAAKEDDTIKEKVEANNKKGVRVYVKIAKEGDEDDIAEVPTNSDGLLPQMTVTALFGGTSAIKYKVTSTGKTWRALLLEDELYHPPEDGWSDRVYTCTQPQKSETRVKVDPVTVTSSLDPAMSTQLTYSASLPPLAAGQTSSLVSPFMAGLPPMAHIWSNGGLNLGTQVSPGIGQSIFGPLGNIGGRTNTIPSGGYSAAPGPFSKNN